MRASIKWVQVFSDALIPVLGYFLWDWGLFFILLYYLLDLLVSEIFMYLKSRAIQLKQGANYALTLRYALSGMFLITSSLFLIRTFILRVHPELDLSQEIIAFWKYKDLGIQQGYLLIPLVFFVGFQRYKVDFLRLKKPETETLNALWMQRLKTLILLLAFTGFIAGTTYFFVFPDWIYLLILLVSTSLYQLVRT